MHKTLQNYKIFSVMTFTFTVIHQCDVALLMSENPKQSNVTYLIPLGSSDCQMNTHDGRRT